ncbi:hypothetical protein ACFQE8_23360 [Salinirubellus sp. GCM10025818]|uniref:hypothetical protein n=1 Tax=Salinirubellus TaxID=2162630 RepID=UPI0030CF0BFA
MASDDRRYPILVDTDALIAVANSSLWNRLTEHVGLTTTNVCTQELERHVENTRETAPEGSRPYRLHYGSRAVPEAAPGSDEQHGDDNPEDDENRRGVASADDFEWDRTTVLLSLLNPMYVRIASRMLPVAL